MPTKHTESILTPKSYEYSNTDFKNYSVVNSIKYKDRIEELCKDLYRSTGIKYYSLTINSKFSTLLCLSNMPHWSITYKKLQLHRCDIAISPEILKNKEFLISANLRQDPLTNLFYDWFEAHGVYETYTIKRVFSEVDIVTIAHHDSLIMDPFKVYEGTLSGLEDFTIAFIDQIKDIIDLECPLLRGSKFLSDAEYRKQIIKREVKIDEPNLSKREKEILFYLIQGLKAKEIAKILHLEFRTVEKYIENMKHKLMAKISLMLLLKLPNQGNRI